MDTCTSAGGSIDSEQSVVNTLDGRELERTLERGKVARFEGIVEFAAEEYSDIGLSGADITSPEHRMTESRYDDVAVIVHPASTSIVAIEGMPK